MKASQLVEQAQCLVENQEADPTIIQYAHAILAFAAENPRLELENITPEHLLFRTSTEVRLAFQMIEIYIVRQEKKKLGDTTNEQNEVKITHPSWPMRLLGKPTEGTVYTLTKINNVKGYRISKREVLKLPAGEYTCSMPEPDTVCLTSKMGIEYSFSYSNQSTRERLAKIIPGYSVKQ